MRPRIVGSSADFTLLKTLGLGAVALLGGKYSWSDSLPDLLLSSFVYQQLGAHGLRDSPAALKIHMEFMLLATRIRPQFPNLHTFRLNFTIPTSAHAEAMAEPHFKTELKLDHLAVPNFLTGAGVDYICQDGYGRDVVQSAVHFNFVFARHIYPRMDGKIHQRA